MNTASIYSTHCLQCDNKAVQEVYRCADCVLYPAYYCSQNCQQLHWNLHSKVCQKYIPQNAYYFVGDTVPVQNLQDQVRRETRVGKSAPETTTSVSGTDPSLSTMVRAREDGKDDEEMDTPFPKNQKHKIEKLQSLVGDIDLKLKRAAQEFEKLEIVKQLQKEKFSREEQTQMNELEAQKKRLQAIKTNVTDTIARAEEIQKQKTLFSTKGSEYIDALQTNVLEQRKFDDAEFVVREEQEKIKSKIDALSSEKFALQIRVDKEKDATRKSTLQSAMRAKDEEISQLSKTLKEAEKVRQQSFAVLNKTRETLDSLKKDLGEKNISLLNLYHQILRGKNREQEWALNRERASQRLLRKALTMNDPVYKKDSYLDTLENYLNDSIVETESIVKDARKFISTIQDSTADKLNPQQERKLNDIMRLADEVFDLQTAFSDGPNRVTLMNIRRNQFDLNTSVIEFGVLLDVLPNTTPDYRLAPDQLERDIQLSELMFCIRFELDKLLSASPLVAKLEKKTQEIIEILKKNDTDEKSTKNAQQYLQQKADAARKFLENDSITKEIQELKSEALRLIQQLSSKQSTKTEKVSTSSKPSVRMPSIGPSSSSPSAVVASEIIEEKKEEEMIGVNLDEAQLEYMKKRLEEAEKKLNIQPFSNGKSAVDILRKTLDGFKDNELSPLIIELLSLVDVIETLNRELSVAQLQETGLTKEEAGLVTRRFFDISLLTEQEGTQPSARVREFANRAHNRTMRFTSRLVQFAGVATALLLGSLNAPRAEAFGFLNALPGMAQQFLSLATPYEVEQTETPSAASLLNNAHDDSRALDRIATQTLSVEQLLSQKSRTVNETAIQSIVETGFGGRENIEKLIREEPDDAHSVSSLLVLDENREEQVRSTLARVSQVIAATTLHDECADSNSVQTLTNAFVDALRSNSSDLVSVAEQELGKIFASRSNILVCRSLVTRIVQRLRAVPNFDFTQFRRIRRIVNNFVGTMSDPQTLYGTEQEKDQLEILRNALLKSEDLILLRAVDASLIKLENRTNSLLDAARLKRGQSLTDESRGVRETKLQELNDSYLFARKKLDTAIKLHLEMDEIEETQKEKKQEIMRRLQQEYTALSGSFDDIIGKIATLEQSAAFDQEGVKKLLVSIEEATKFFIDSIQAVDAQKQIQVRENYDLILEEIILQQTLFNSESTEDDFSDSRRDVIPSEHIQQSIVSVLDIVSEMTKLSVKNQEDEQKKRRQMLSRLMQNQNSIAKNDLELFLSGLEDRVGQSAAQKFARMDFKDLLFSLDERGALSELAFIDYEMTILPEVYNLLVDLLGRSENEKLATLTSRERRQLADALVQVTKGAENFISLQRDPSLISNREYRNQVDPTQYTPNFDAAVVDNFESLFEQVSRDTGDVRFANIARSLRRFTNKLVPLYQVESTLMSVLLMLFAKKLIPVATFLGLVERGEKQRNDFFVNTFEQLLTATESRFEVIRNRILSVNASQQDKNRLREKSDDLRLAFRQRWLESIRRIRQLYNIRSHAVIVDIVAQALSEATIDLSSLFFYWKLAPIASFLHANANKIAFGVQALTNDATLGLTQSALYSNLNLIVCSAPAALEVFTGHGIVRTPFNWLRRAAGHGLVGSVATVSVSAAVVGGMYNSSAPIVELTGVQYAPLVMLVVFVLYAAFIGIGYSYRIHSINELAKLLPPREKKTKDQ